MMPIQLDADQFDALVEQAIETLPEWIETHMENVVITAASWPSRHQIKASGVRQGYTLLGLYEGVPLSKRGRGYHLQPPDHVTLFQRPLESIATDKEHLATLIRRTIIHEIAHHFGFSDAEIYELEGRDDS